VVTVVAQLAQPAGQVRVRAPSGLCSGFGSAMGSGFCFGLGSATCVFLSHLLACYLPASLWRWCYFTPPWGVFLLPFSTPCSLFSLGVAVAVAVAAPLPAPFAAAAAAAISVRCPVQAQGGGDGGVAVVGIQRGQPTRGWSRSVSAGLVLAMCLSEGRFNMLGGRGLVHGSGQGG